MGMTLDEAIKHAEEVADKKEREKQKWERWLETDSDYRAVNEKVSCELCAEEHRQLAEWLKELKQLREQPRWIPVSERLPKPQKYGNKDYSDWVQITLHIGKYCDAVGRAYYCFSEKKWYMNELGVGEITAWMPLPQPYKAESEDKE